MGFNDQEIVALSGAHALGRCHRDRSGFDGPWTFSPISVTNEYFKLLFDESWVWKKWDGPKQLEDKKTKSLMMLPYVVITISNCYFQVVNCVALMCRTDYVLVQDRSFKKFAKQYARQFVRLCSDTICVAPRLPSCDQPLRSVTVQYSIRIAFLDLKYVAIVRVTVRLA